MGDVPGPCYHRPPQSSMFQLPHLGSFNAPPIIGHSPINSLSADSGVIDMASLQNGQFNQSNGWFYCLPRFRQAFSPPPGLSYSSLGEKQLPVPAYGNGSDNAAAAASTIVNRSSGDAQKKFLVIDKSGDQTTLMISSGIGTPFQCLTSWSSRHLNFPDLKYQVCGVKADENDESDSKSEMHEDPDELDALLYSSSDEDEDDDGFCSEDDEVTSTGHSPSTMTAHERRGSEESMDEVAWPIRKRKQLPDGEPFEEDTASSGKAMDIHTEYCCLHDDNNDAQSSCGDGNMGSGSKRIRREKIRETVSILQDMIPGGGGSVGGKGKKKDAVVVLDEAIKYLKSLKANAGALGLCHL